MLQYPVAMEIVALASAGFFTGFEQCAEAKFSVWYNVHDSLHLIVIKEKVHSLRRLN